MQKTNYLLAGCIITLAYIWYLFPLLSQANQALPGDQDELLITWQITEIARQFPAFPSTLMQGTIFAPHQYTHAFTEPFITSAVLAKPVLMITDNPLLGYHVTLLFGLILTTWCLYLFIDEIIDNPSLSLAMSLVFGFSRVYLHYLPHLQYICIWWVPLSGWIILRYIRSSNPAWIYAWFCCVLAQFYNSFLPVYFILFLTCVIFLGKPSAKKVLQAQWRHWLFGTVACAVLIWPLASVYLTVVSIYNYTRPLTEVIHFSLSPEELFTKFYSPILYLVLTVSSISIFPSSWTAAKHRLKDKQTRLLWILLLSAGLAVVLALGPALHWMRQTVKLPFHVPLPYLVLYYLVPGFQAIRTPSRWILLAGIFSTVASSIWLKRFGTKPPAQIWISILLAGGIIVTTSQYNQSVSIAQANDLPSVYQWLATQPQQTLLELPIEAWGNTPQHRQEAYRMYYSLFHSHNLVNGYSGFFPPSYVTLVNQLKADTSPTAKIASILKTSAHLLVVHVDQYAITRSDLSMFLDGLITHSQISLVYQDDSTQIYALHQ